MTSRSDHFRSLHASGSFLMPNPFDAGTARLLERLGCSALATTSAGFAGTLGRLDMTVTRDEVVAHVAALANATTVPLNVDSERCYADDLDGIGITVALLAEAGAAGFSIEDWDPVSNQIDSLAGAARRVGTAAAAARQSGMVLTARCENHLHGITDLGNTIARLSAYAAEGAEVLYAPGLVDPGQIEAIVAIGLPVNVLLMPGGPTVQQLADLGVRRVSVGGSLASIAQGAVAQITRDLLAGGNYAPDTSFLPKALRDEAFAPR